MSSVNKSPVGNADVSGVRSNVSNAGNAGVGASTGAGAMMGAGAKFGKYGGKIKIALIVVGALVVCMVAVKLNKKKQSLARSKGSGGGGANSGIKKLVNLGFGSSDSSDKSGQDSAPLTVSK